MMIGPGMLVKTTLSTLVLGLITTLLQQSSLFEQQLLFLLQQLIKTPFKVDKNPPKT